MEQYAGRGTTALGILGTTLGGIAVAGPTLLNGWGGRMNGYSDVCKYDLETVKQIGERDAEIARLRSEKYADNVREDAKQYGIELYKELAGKINDFKAEQVQKWTEQAVTNAIVSDNLTALTGTTQNLAHTLGHITKIAVPQSAICDFDGRSHCGGCGNNI